MITKLLVPTDGSESAMEAATYAAALARQFDATVTLLHVVEVPRLSIHIPPFGTLHRDQLREELYETGRAILAMAQQPFLQAGVPVETQLREGRVVDRIAEVAVSGRHDLIVMGSRGTGIPAREFLGSVSDEVAQVAPCPLLIVRRGTVRVLADTKGGEDGREQHQASDHAHPGAD